MTKQQYTTKTGKKQFRPVLSQRQLERIIYDGNGKGFCLACGRDASGVEPDARKYSCQSCQAPKVYGIEELLMMGLVVVKGE